MSDLGLAEVMRTEIEEPATRELLTLLRAGKILEKDVDKFRVTVSRYHEAVLEQTGGLDPIVRNELVGSLLADYRAQVGELIKKISNREEPRVASQSSPAVMADTRKQDHTVRVASGVPAPDSHGGSDAEGDRSTPSSQARTPSNAGSIEPDPEVRDVTRRRGWVSWLLLSSVFIGTTLVLLLSRHGFF